MEVKKQSKIAKVHNLNFKPKVFVTSCSDQNQWRGILWQYAA